MKNLMIMMAIAIGVTSCASKEQVASNSHALAQREIASESNCYLEIHPRNKNWYRVSIDGNPYNKHWYSKKDAMKMKSGFDKKGKCY
jgi:hypothetical protein